MRRALGEYDVAGIRTNIAFFLQMLEDAEFRAGHLHTHFVDEFLERRPRLEPSQNLKAIAELVAAFHTKQSAVRLEAARPAQSRWRDMGRQEGLR